MSESATRWVKMGEAGGWRGGGKGGKGVEVRW